MENQVATQPKIAPIKALSQTVSCGYFILVLGKFNLSFQLRSVAQIIELMSQRRVAHAKATDDVGQNAVELGYRGNRIASGVVQSASDCGFEGEIAH